MRFSLFGASRSGVPIAAAPTAAPTAATRSPPEPLHLPDGAGRSGARADPGPARRARPDLLGRGRSAAPLHRPQPHGGAAAADSMQRARAELLRRIDAHADAEAMLSSHRHAVQDFRRRWTAAEVAAGASASLAGLRSDVASAWDRMASAVTTFDATAVAAVSASAAAVEAHRALVEATDAATAARMQLSVTSEAASRAREDLVAAQGKVTGLQQDLAAGLKDGLTRFLHQEKQQAARKAVTNAHTVFEGLQVRAAEQAATAREAETVRTACEQRAVYADKTAQDAMALRGWPQSWGLPEEALATLIKALPQVQPASGGSPGASARWTSRLADRLRRPFQALKLRTAAPQVEIAIGPVTLSRSTASPTVVSGDGASSRPARIPARPTRQSGSRAVDHLVQVASRETARGVVSATSHPRSAVQGASAIKVPDTPPRVHIPAAYGRAKDFSDEIVRMFASPASGGAADSASAAAAGIAGPVQPRRRRATRQSPPAV